MKIKKAITGIVAPLVLATAFSGCAARSPSPTANNAYYTEQDRAVSNVLYFVGGVITGVLMSGGGHHHGGHHHGGHHHGGHHGPCCR